MLVKRTFRSIGKRRKWPMMMMMMTHVLSIGNVFVGIVG